jgi:hypothetical protein
VDRWQQSLDYIEHLRQILIGRRIRVIHRNCSAHPLAIHFLGSSPKRFVIARLGERLRGVKQVVVVESPRDAIETTPMHRGSGAESCTKTSHSRSHGDTAPSSRPDSRED